MRWMTQRDDIFEDDDLEWGGREREREERERERKRERKSAHARATERVY